MRVDCCRIGSCTIPGGGGPAGLGGGMAPGGGGGREGAGPRTAPGGGGGGGGPGDDIEACGKLSYG